jgi:hypothetical protein
VPAKFCKRRHPGHRRMYGASWFALRVGVANNEDSGAGMGSPNVSRVNPKGTRSVSKHVQVSPHRGQPLSGGCASDVLDHNVRRAKLGDDTRELGPEPGALSRDSSAKSV